MNSSPSCPSDESSEPESVEIPCVWFFLPLPEPLGLPDHWIAGQVLSRGQVVRSEGPLSGLHTSLIIHQLEPSADPFAIATADLSIFASSTMLRIPAPTTGADAVAAVGDLDLGAIKSVRTIAEVACPRHPTSTDEELLAALDSAIGQVRSVQRAVAMATQRPLTLMTRRTLPPMVPMYEGVVYAAEGGRPPDATRAILQQIPDCAPPTALGLRPDEYDDATLHKINVAMDRISEDAPFNVYSDLRREAMRQDHFSGSNRMTLVGLATAGEVLLDSMLLSMLWEEHTPPADAVFYFDRSEGHTARVSRYFPARLGGGWDVNSTTPAGEYLRVLVRLRHRVVHAGHDPLNDEITASWACLFALEKYLSDRLADDKNLKRYTATAIAWMGEPGLAKRSKLTRHVKETMEAYTDQDMTSAYSRWSRYVDLALGVGLTPGQAEDGVVLYADLLDDGTIRWILHDPHTGHASLVDGSAAATTVGAAAAVAHLNSVKSADRGDRRVALAPGPLATGLRWQPDHEIVPEFAQFPPTATAMPATGVPTTLQAKAAPSSANAAPRFPWPVPGEAWLTSWWQRQRGRPRRK